MIHPWAPLGARIVGIGLTVCLLGLPGCAIQHPPIEPLPTPSSDANALLKRGEFSEAAAAFEQLAAANDPAASHYLLMAAEAHYRAGHRTATERLVETLSGRVLNDEDSEHYGLLSSQLALDNNQFKAALRQLDNLGGAPSDPTGAISYHRLRAAALTNLHKPIDSVRERIMLSVYLQGEAAVRNKQVILSTLLKVPGQEIRNWPKNPPDILSGWIELAGLLGTHPAGSAPLAAAVLEWQARYPEHPADPEFLRSYLPNGLSSEAAPAVAPKTEGSVFEPGGFVAVLLPLSGKLQPAGQAIRMGLVSAYYEVHQQRPALRFFDTEGRDAGELYAMVVRQGADYVIGPLMKKDIETVARLPVLSVPVLALNQLNELQKDNLYQFGLTPEEEVEQAASSAWLDGHKRALLLTPSTEFGNRLQLHFREYWRRIGGNLVGTSAYAAGGRNLPDALRNLLSLGGRSPGQDPAAASSDWLFVIADGRDARLIHAQLESYQQAGLPVYTTSQVYGGMADTTATRDLSGYVFCDAPWMISPPENPNLSPSALESAWGKLPDDYLRLVAMGLDAYALMYRLSDLMSSPQNQFRGATGNLSLGPGNRVKRQLDCASFEGGMVRVRGPAPLFQSEPLPAPSAI